MLLKDHHGPPPFNDCFVDSSHKTPRPVRPIFLPKRHGSDFATVDTSNLKPRDAHRDDLCFRHDYGVFTSRVWELTRWIQTLLSVAYLLGDSSWRS
jgi:hypothetical protein